MFKPLRVLVCGGRDFANIPMIKDVNGFEVGPDLNHPNYLTKLDEELYIFQTLYMVCDEFNILLRDKPSNIFIIEGGARGADRAAYKWRKENKLDGRQFKADWDTYAKAAGPIRNKQMLDEGKPDLVIAFPGGSGTADMIKQANAAKIPLRIMKYKDVEKNDNII